MASRMAFITIRRIHDNIEFIYDMRSGNVDEYDFIATWGQRTRERCFGQWPNGRASTEQCQECWMVRWCQAPALLRQTRRRRRFIAHLNIPTSTGIVGHLFMLMSSPRSVQSTGSVLSGRFVGVPPARQTPQRVPGGGQRSPCAGATHFRRA